MQAPRLAAAPPRRAGLTALAAATPPPCGPRTAAGRRRAAGSSSGAGGARPRPRSRRRALPAERAGGAAPGRRGGPPGAADVQGWRSAVPGDSGWDPLKLRARDAKTFNRFREVEVIHARWAMLGVMALLLGDAPGTPVSPQTLSVGVLAPWGLTALLGVAFIESSRLAALWGEDDVDARAYPGQRFDPLGLARRARRGRRAGSAAGEGDAPPPLAVFSSWLGGAPGWLAGGWWWERREMTEGELLDMKSRELRNGRLAMVSFLGCCAASALTGKGPITLLVQHITDPAHNTIVQSLGQQPAQAAAAPAQRPRAPRHRRQQRPRAAMRTGGAAQREAAQGAAVAAAGTLHDAWSLLLAHPAVCQDVGVVAKLLATSRATRDADVAAVAAALRTAATARPLRLQEFACRAQLGPAAALLRELPASRLTSLGLYLHAGWAVSHLPRLAAALSRLTALRSLNVFLEDEGAGAHRLLPALAGHRQLTRLALNTQNGLSALPASLVHLAAIGNVRDPLPYAGRDLRHLTALTGLTYTAGAGDALPPNLEEPGGAGREVSVELDYTHVDRATLVNTDEELLAAAPVWPRLPLVCLRGVRLARPMLPHLSQLRGLTMLKLLGAAEEGGLPSAAELGAALGQLTALRELDLLGIRLAPPPLAADGAPQPAASLALVTAALSRLPSLCRFALFGSPGVFEAFAPPATTCLCFEECSIDDAALYAVAQRLTGLMSLHIVDEDSPLTGAALPVLCERLTQLTCLTLPAPAVTLANAHCLSALVRLRQLWGTRACALLLLALAGACTAAAQPDCAAGCAGDFAPATGADGLTYINACVARCQGVAVASENAGQAPVPGARPVTAADMAAHEGFNFIDFARVRRVQPTLRGATASSVGAPSLAGLPTGRVIMYDVPRGAIYVTPAPAAMPADAAEVSVAAVPGSGVGPVYAPQATQPAPQPAAGGDAEMWTPTLDVDLGNILPKASPSPAPAGEEQQQQQQQGGGRRLAAVQTPDERVAVASPPSGLPLAAVGQLLGHGQEWHCSASLIGERTLLTAAHCLYDRNTGSFARGLYFVPGRVRGADGAIVAPWGAFDVSAVYIMSQFVSGEPQSIWGADMAVVTLRPDVRLGAVVGRLGISVPAAPAAAAAAPPAADVRGAARDVVPTSAAAPAAPRGAGRKAGPGGRRARTPAAPAAEQLWEGSLRTAGYPSDRPEGTLITTTCAASQALAGGPAGTIRIGCSTHLGQSGSPVFTDGLQVRGVVSFEIAGADGYNGASAITHYLWANLIQPRLQ
ncbi:LHCA1 [Scenedesmus sp. PABB004]|nr:LHCA1 [Scenedesmus sp. PABB004]